MSKDEVGDRIKCLKKGWNSNKNVPKIPKKKGGGGILGKGVCLKKRGCDALSNHECMNLTNMEVEKLHRQTRRI